jgi:hypothetical protein
MPDIPVPGGLTAKEIVDQAYTGLGMSDSFFGRTQEEYAAGQGLLRAMVGEWPFDQLGYDGAETDLSAETGIERKWLNVVGLSLAERIGPGIGKQLQPAFLKVKANSYSRLCAAVANLPTVEFAAGTPRGAGHRGYYQRGTYFPEVA